MRRREKTRARRRRAGMTLIEIMIVVIVMALIATAVGVAVLPMLERAKVKQATVDAASIRGVAEYWLADHGTCPSMVELREAGEVNESGRASDPWDTPWSIECEASRVIVISAGPDRQLGTEDDIPVEEG